MAKTNKTTISPLRLGATMYMPGTNHPMDKQLPVARGEKYPMLKSMVLCTEDSVSEADVPAAMANIRKTLGTLLVMGKGERPLAFVRPRNPDILSEMMQWDCLDAVDGFVIPKFHAGNAETWLSRLCGKPFMPTLETVHTFDQGDLRETRDIMLSWSADAVSVRVGGLDLLGVMRLRRPKGTTMYDTPVGPVIDSIVSVFRPWGFNVSAPACEYMDDEKLLRRETRMDLAKGLFGKTAVHPRQIAVIEAELGVSESDLATARKILSPESPAVFRMGDAMCEKAVHTPWALETVQRYNLYGCLGGHVMEEDNLHAKVA